MRLKDLPLRVTALTSAVLLVVPAALVLLVPPALLLAQGLGTPCGLAWLAAASFLCYAALRQTRF